MSFVEQRDFIYFVVAATGKKGSPFLLSYAAPAASCFPAAIDVDWCCALGRHSVLFFDRHFVSDKNRQHNQQNKAASSEKCRLPFG